MGAVDEGFSAVSTVSVAVGVSAAGKELSHTKGIVYEALSRKIACISRNMGMVVNAAVRESRREGSVGFGPFP